LVSIRDEHYLGDEMRERDKVLLNSFGIGYDQRRRRVVVVYLRYLADLSVEHQQYWLTHVVSEDCTMNSDYERATIWGAWPQYRSAYAAFLAEQVEIDRLCELIGKPPIFRKVYEDERPEGFATMLRPTRRNFLEFAHVLDKMLSDNMEKSFFDGDVDLVEEITRGDGRVEVREKGTIALLKEWLDAMYTAQDGRHVGTEVTQPFREVPKVRQQPAHTIQPDEYDLAYVQRQDELLGRVVRSLAKLRLILQSHPLAAGRYEPPAWLDGSRIVFY
jgi:hypothetical protein